jgi:molecular chaperone DnaJ
MSKRDYYETWAWPATPATTTSRRPIAAGDEAPPRPQSRRPSREAAFKECKEAYEVLSDGPSAAPTTSTATPRSNTAWAAAAAAPGFADMGDIFGDIFGNIFGGGAAGGPRRGADLGYVMELDLEEAVSGIEKRIEVPTLVACQHCNGTGSKTAQVETCTTCHGRGQVRMQRGIFQMQQTCPHCAGRGKTSSIRASRAWGRAAWKKKRSCR